MTAVTISRQLGSLGTTLGKRIASQLGYRLVHRELINKAAQQAGSPAMALATIDELGLLGIEPDEPDQQAYLTAVQEIILEYGKMGNIVIVGRAGQVILSQNPKAFHLRVIAPLEIRIQRIINVHKIPSSAAKAQILDSDTHREMYLKKFYDTDWNDHTRYHLIINTGKINLSNATDIVCHAILNHQSPRFTKEATVE